MAAAISAADRSLDLVISLSMGQTRYSGCLITKLAFEPRYSGTRQLTSSDTEYLAPMDPAVQYMPPTILIASTTIPIDT
jgi:hypothetical protein